MPKHPRGYLAHFVGTTVKYSDYKRFKRYKRDVPKKAHYLCKFQFIFEVHKNEPLRTELFCQYNWSNLWDLNLISCKIDDREFDIFVKGKDAYPNICALSLCNS